MSLRIAYDRIEPTYFNLTLGDRLTVGTGAEYTIVFTYEQTGLEYSTGFTDESSYPMTFNRFYITTNLTGTTDSQNVPFFLQGWYKYEVYQFTDTDRDFCLEFGQCYIYDNNDDAPGNTPDDTEVYIEEKTKYVYKRT